MKAIVEAINNLADAIREKNSNSPWIKDDKEAISHLPFGKTKFYELKSEIPHRTMVDKGHVVEFYDKRDLDEWLENYSEKVGN